jgi:hypothetical protein
MVLRGSSILVAEWCGEHHQLFIYKKLGFYLPEIRKSQPTEYVI